MLRDVGSRAYDTVEKREGENCIFNREHSIRKRYLHFKYLYCISQLE